MKEELNWRGKPMTYSDYYLKENCPVFYELLMTGVTPEQICKFREMTCDDRAYMINGFTIKRKAKTFAYQIKDIIRLQEAKNILNLILDKGNKIRYAFEYSFYNKDFLK